MFNSSYTKIPSPDNSDEEVDPLDSFMAQIEVRSMWATDG